MTFCSIKHKHFRRFPSFVVVWKSTNSTASLAEKEFQHDFRLANPPLKHNILTIFIYPNRFIRMKANQFRTVFKVRLFEFKRLKHILVVLDIFIQFLLTDRRIFRRRDIKILTFTKFRNAFLRLFIDAFTLFTIFVMLQWNLHGHSIERKTGFFRSRSFF